MASTLCGSKRDSCTRGTACRPMTKQAQAGSVGEGSGLRGSRRGNTVGACGRSLDHMLCLAARFHSKQGVTPWPLFLVERAPPDALGGRSQRAEACTLHE